MIRAVSASWILACILQELEHDWRVLLRGDLVRTVFRMAILAASVGGWVVQIGGREVGRVQGK